MSLSSFFPLPLQPVAALGLIFIIASVFQYTGGWFFFVGVWYIVYVVIVFVIEMCIPRVFIYRLIVSALIDSVDSVTGIGSA